MDNLEPKKKEQEVARDSRGSEREAGKTKGRQRRLLNDFIQISTIAWTTIANVATGVFLGYWADRLLVTQPIFTVLLSIMGVVAAIRFLFHFSRKS